MKKLLLVSLQLLLLTLSTQSLAGYLYESEFRRLGSNYISLLSQKSTDSLNELSNDKRNACIHRYRGILSDGFLDVRIAIGYFDWTVGYPLELNGQNYGLSPSMDLGAYAALRSLLLAPCYGKTKFCGFTQDQKSSYRFFRDVTIQGNQYRARVEVYFASASEYLYLNTGKNLTQQKERTQFMEKYFATALTQADAVFYFGHSRTGGGPDFAPPVFISGKNKVNHAGYYQVHKPGLKKMVAALSNSTTKTPVIGLMSCDSRDLFLNRVRNLAPGSGVITSLAVIDVDQVYTAMIGAVDALLRGQCQSSFYQSLRMTAQNQKYITMDGMFE